MQVDFSAAFHLAPILDFVYFFPTRVVVAQHGEYLTEEPRLNI
jgi:hypothetical protein